MEDLQSKGDLWEQKKKQKVLIAAHRGTCGGNIIQNTCKAYENALLHGADMIEIDVIMSTDGDFFAFHNGQEIRVIGVEKDIRRMSTNEIETYQCINQLGEEVTQRLERLDMILERFRGRCFINIDRSWFFWKEMIDYLDKMGMEEQILLKSPVKKELLETLQDSQSKVMYMPIVKTMEEWDLVQKYDIRLTAAELIFENLESPFAAPEFIGNLHQKGLLAWVNAITLNDRTVLSGFLDDDQAIMNGFQSSWGRLIDLGFDIIQTDWPMLLKQYVAEETA